MTRPLGLGLVEALFAKGLRRILIEGGARTIAAFIEANCLDRLHLLVAPMIIGSGRPGLDLFPAKVTNWRYVRTRKRISWRAATFSSIAIFPVVGNSPIEDLSRKQ